jgi:hypothetical protein
MNWRGSCALRVWLNQGGALPACKGVLLGKKGVQLGSRGVLFGQTAFLLSCKGVWPITTPFQVGKIPLQLGQTPVQVGRTPLLSSQTACKMGVFPMNARSQRAALDD